VNIKKNEKTNKWVDTHCHIQHTNLDLEKVDLSNIEWLLIPGVNVKSSLSASELSSTLPIKSYWGAGLHPHEASNLNRQKNELLKLFQLADAIGETGLDYYRNLSDKASQIKSFEMHVASAIELEKTLIVHCRDSFEDVHRIIKQNDFTAPVVLHSWTGGSKWTKKFMDLNVYFSFSGIITYVSAKDIQIACEKIPMSNILLETDTPYLVPSTVDDEVNQPRYIENTAIEVARIKNIDVQTLSSVTIENSSKCFIEKKGPNE